MAKAANEAFLLLVGSRTYAMQTEPAILSIPSQSTLSSHNFLVGRTGMFLSDVGSSVGMFLSQLTLAVPTASSPKPHSI